MRRNVRFCALAQKAWNLFVISPLLTPIGEWHGNVLNAAAHPLRVLVIHAQDIPVYCYSLNSGNSPGIHRDASLAEKLICSGDLLLVDVNASRLIRAEVIRRA
jgi:hypothetical protein